MKQAQSKRDEILGATKELLHEVGFEAMSPRMVLKRSGAGQGSLYHHFDSKKTLARAAMDEVAEELIDRAKAVLDDESKSPLERIEAYLLTERDGLKGCKLGRLSNETAIQEDELRVPLERYFSFLLIRVKSLLEDAEKKGELVRGHRLAGLAHVIVAVIQGGYVLSRALNDADTVNDTTAGAVHLINKLRVSKART